jgi:hypothetical protein
VSAPQLLQYGAAAAATALSAAYHVRGARAFTQPWLSSHIAQHSPAPAHRRWQVCVLVGTAGVGGTITFTDCPACDECPACTKVTGEISGLVREPSTVRPPARSSSLLC